MMTTVRNRRVALAGAIFVAGMLVAAGFWRSSFRDAGVSPSPGEVRQIESPVVAAGNSQTPAAAPATVEDDTTTTGRITGIISDAETRAPLPYANVVLLGTSLGAISLDDGSFTITAPAGSFEVQALYIGYEKTSGRVTLPPRGTARIDLALQPDTFDMSCIEVSADKCMIQVDRANTSRRVGADQFRAMSVEDVNEAVALKAGVTSQGGELHFRGGAGGDRATYVDGVPMRDPLGQSRSRISSAASQKAEVITEGYEAEYGNATSGTTTVPAARGGQQHRQSSDAASRLNPPPSGRHDELWVIERSTPTKPAPGAGDAPRSCVMLTRIGDDSREVAVPLKHTAVEARVSAYIATVTVKQQFHNPFAQKIEATYQFPLPQNAAVNEFVMTIGERRIRGIIREREEAQRIYRQARRQGRVASLLTQERPNIFTQKVANIEPGKEIDVDIHYYHTLAYVDGWYEFVFPMVVGPRYNPPGHSDPITPVARGTSNPSAPGTQIEYLRPDERTGHDIALDLYIDAGVELEEIDSVNHVIETSRPTPNEAAIALAAGDRIPNKDFVLRYKVAGDQVKSALMTHEDERGGFFSLVLYPPASMHALPRAPVEMIFVLDCSGSMSGLPIAKGKAAIDRALRNLGADDTFQLIRFSNNASQLGPVPLAATAANIAHGRAHLESLTSWGGTEVIEGIKAALDFPHDPRRLRLVSFVTDGYIGNEAEIFRETQARLGESRIFSFGIGSSPNRYLLEGLARFGKGAVAYVGLDESAGQAVDLFYERIRYPALTDIAIDWGDWKVSDVYPARIPDLFPGRAVVLTGRFEGEVANTVTVHGTVAGKRQELPLAVAAPGRRDQHPGIPSVWARQRIKDLMDLLATAPVADAESEITRFALDYSLVSRFTAFVAVDARSDTGTEPAVSTAVAVPVPEGVLYETTVGNPHDH